MPTTLALALRSAKRFHRASNGAGAAHVPLHRFHAGSGLDRDAAGVEGDALADEGRPAGRPAAAIPAKDQQPRLADRALGDAEKRAHAELLHRLAIEHFELDAGFHRATS